MLANARIHARVRFLLERGRGVPVVSFELGLSLRKRLAFTPVLRLRLRHGIFPRFELVGAAGQEGLQRPRTSDRALFRIFVRFFRETGLTKRGNGCILYSAGSKKSWCSPQNDAALDLVSAESGADSEEKSKNLSKLA